MARGGMKASELIDALLWAFESGSIANESKSADRHRLYLEKALKIYAPLFKAAPALLAASELLVRFGHDGKSPETCPGCVGEAAIALARGKQ